MNIQTISNDHLTLNVLPDLGASVLNLAAASGRPVLRHVEIGNVKTSSQCASFALLPYSNRIRDARFTFEGRSVQLTPNSGSLAQHGDVRNRPWQVERVSDSHLACTFDSRSFADVNWPWAFTARLEYILHGPHLDTSVTLTNQGSAPMPAGMGLHPYFSRIADGTDPALSFQAGGVYLTDDSFIPTEGPHSVAPELDFSAARTVGGAQFNHVYSSWDGVARLAWADSGRALVMTADSVWSHLVLFTAPDGSLALEPVTHATDAFNLAAAGIHGTDMRVLAAGQSMGGAVRLTLEGDWS
ncbi:aldose 1-epimerase [Deinococcus altitudinis]|uniref:aldose 1-epimerase n=1 Tax=Deinococcus altitudinis TaxID=468914 RepID=UPI0038920CD1